MTSFSQKMISALSWSAVVGVCLVPLVTLAFQVKLNSAFFSLLFDGSVLDSLKLTLALSFTSLMSVLVLGIPTSYLLARTNVKGAQFFSGGLLFPFFVPSYLFAIAWVVLALPHVGLLNRFVGSNWLNIYSFPGLVWVTCNAFFPIIITTVTQGFKKMEPSFEEAARVCGASPLKIFWRISLPCQLSNIIGASLVFLFITLSSFGIPAIVGNPAKLFVLTSQIYTYTKMGGLSGIQQGFTVSLWLMFFSILLATVGRRLKQYHTVVLTLGKANRPSRIELGRMQLPAILFLSLLCIILVLLPLGALLLNSFFKVAGDLSWDNLTLNNYHYLFQLRETPNAIFNSLTLAGLGGLICCGLGLLVSYISHKTQGWGHTLIEKIATLPFSLPGTVIALACIVSFGTGWGHSHYSLFGTPFLLLIAYIGKDLAIAVQTLGPALNQIDKSLEEAGRICGLGPLGVLDRILFPLLIPSLSSGFILCALPMLSELTMSVLLFGPGTETLGTLIFQLQDYSNPLAACALATLLVVFLGLGMLIVRLVRGERK